MIIDGSLFDMFMFKQKNISDIFMVSSIIYFLPICVAVSINGYSSWYSDSTREKGRKPIKIIFYILACIYWFFAFGWAVFVNALTAR